MKNKLTNIEEYKGVKEYAKNQFLEELPEKLIISEHQQREEIEKLKMGLRHEAFFFIVDVTNFSIIEAYGLESVGFHSEMFTMAQYAQLLPSQGVLRLLSLFWKKIFEFCEEEEDLLGFLKPKYIVQIPFKNSKGEMMLVKRSISPFQFTQSRKLTQYLSEFTIIKYGFDSESPEPRFIEIPKRLEEKLTKSMKSSFDLEPTPYSPKEKTILKIYAADDGSTPTKELANLAGVTPSTLQSYNKEILNHTKDFLGDIYKFDNAKQVAKFFMKCGVLN